MSAQLAPLEVDRVTEAGGVAQVQAPERFRGTFARTWSRYEPLMAEAREVLRRLPVREDIRAHYDYGVVDGPQPSYMLLPLMYLAVADDQGGITRRHVEYLPWYMLAMEAVAILDDTVDRTPFRSTRMTYPHRYGESSAAAFAGYLMTVVFERTAASAPEVLPLVYRFFETLCSLEVWEFHARYPAVEPEALQGWLRNRYEMATDVYCHSFNAALRLHGLGDVSREACAHFAALSQAVDDLVGVAEDRECIGENDDLKMGIVTFPLVATLAAEPRAAELLERVWTPCRALRPQGNEGFLRELDGVASRFRGECAQLNRWMLEHGTPRSIDEILRHASLMESKVPPGLRRFVRDVSRTYLDRLRDLDPRARYEAP